MEDIDRLNAEWISLNAFRGLTKIASRGDMVKSNYDNALQLGGEVYPELLGDEVSLLKRERESDTTKEYRQKANLSSIRDGREILAFDLVVSDISEYESLLEVAEQTKNNQRVDQLRRKLAQLYKSKKELDPEDHTENQLIFRDAYNVERSIPTITNGHSYRDFELPNGKVLRLRVLHPDRVEHISGADLIYERHNPENESVAIVAVQYKIWKDRKLYLSDERMIGQLDKMKNLLCNSDVCKSSNKDHGYRFPCCAAFIRPTDKLQKPEQKFLSTGEHLPICKIEECLTTGERGAPILEYEKIKEISLSSEIFEFLFNKGKIGSRELSYSELTELYAGVLEDASKERVVIYAQEL
ncbi:hypothetical protein I6M33_16545 [Shewanella algae]|uniref:hypothetical protein n=1 Tax=Shewanella algae TaxID=38313 RepID=UPI001AAC89A7|nr:hypothetical protein [Shewanella algae]MBO2557941.1 hypothetical protein [Shewanella algae]MBO2562192.1 hypothetical protein [Shewanella algae]MBO2574877.1 hypothetical protein [Shewanella algae]MBO2617338.1 hypothetical protein [Shewanella algae]